MTTTNPPRLAWALMRWMGPRDEALTGDLLEAYREGRSNWWYWHQVLTAIVIGAITAVRSHKVLAIRAIVLGWLVVWIYANYGASFVFVAARTAVNFGEFLFVTGLTDYFWVRGIDFPRTVVESAPSIVTAWVGMFASGWLVGRLHRSLGAAMVLVYFATLPLPAIGTILWQIAAYGRYAGPPLPMLVVIFFLTAYLPALAGGLWDVRPRRQHSPTLSEPRSSRACRSPK